MIDPSRTAAIVLRQFYLMRNSASRILPLFTWAAIDIVLWGFFTKYLNSVSASGMNFVSVMLGAVLMWDFFIRVMHGLVMAFFEDVWSRNFLNIFASPLSISEYLCGLVIISIATSLVGLIVMLLIATCCFGLSFFLYGFAAIPSLLVLFLFGVANGILGSSLVLRFGPAAEWFAWPIPALLSPFACVFYPLSVLPWWMQYVARILPPSYVFEGLRSLVLEGHLSLVSLSSGMLLALFYVVLSARFFVNTYQRAVRTGLIARYSAESLS